jgi:NitT/TauT family transport system permease protein
MKSPRENPVQSKAVAAMESEIENARQATTLHAQGQKKRRRLDSLQDFLVRALFVVFLIGVWHIAHYFLVTRSGLWSGALFRTPKEVALWLWNDFGFSYLYGEYSPPIGKDPKSFWEAFRIAPYPNAIVQSIWRLLKGYVIATVIGFPLGLLVARFSLAEKTIGWLSTSLQSLPSVCWTPIALLWFGRLGDMPILFVTIMGALFATVVAVADSIRQVPPLMARAGRTMGADGSRLYFSVLLPAALPNIVTGMKIGWAFAWRSLMAAELIVYSGGLGFLLENDRENANPEGVVATIIVIIIIGLGVQELIFTPLQNRLNKLWGLSGVR